ncbi:hypothetical protein GCM10011531_18840 [Aquaticitalea lipolytica]|uniref:Amino acid permease n=1 Tax=Aquaticitalea lipolytica TaxID=1247562 RepID=A0A8J2TPT9_9FLAO|nr:DUF3810 domain-containing protein [Aquaticitalea lipolytica]GFZ87579.1 hypothetical protein GCM10011531_18840 [Aquaticitalea lipolytica]
MRKYTKPIIAFSILLQIVVIKLLAQFPEFVESVYSNGIYIFISKLMHYVFGWIPFSVGDIFYTIAGIYILRWLFVNRKRILKDTKNWFLDVMVAVSVGYFAFHFLWAFNYYRLPLHKSLQIEADYTTEELLNITNQLIVKSNAAHIAITHNDSVKVEMPYTKTELLNLIPEGYNELSKQFPHLAYKPKSLKRSLYSLPLTYMGFSGYLNPFTNEAQIDGLIPTYKYPTTASHEVAHQLGYAAENEANFIGAMASINHKNKYFKYSGYTYALQHCLSEVYQRDTTQYDMLIPKINVGILKNYAEVNAFWKGYQNPTEPFFKLFYNGFLKANNQTKGIESYNYVVGLLVNYYKVNNL